MRRIIVLLSMAAALLAVTFPAAAAPPTNDNFASAQVVTVAPTNQQPTEVTAFNTAEATTEAGENTCADQYSVWYTFTLTESKRVGISAHALTQMYPSIILQETRVGLYASDGQTLLRCQVGGTYKSAVFAETLDAGTYYVQVGAAAAPMQYIVFFQEPALNDDFANAREILIPAPTHLLSNGMATIEANEPACGEQYTIWYKFTLDQRTAMQFYGSAPNMLLSVDVSFGIFRDDGTLTPVVCRQGMELDVAFKRTLDAGTYYIQLGGVGHPRFFQLMIQSTPENDSFRNAEKINFPLEDYVAAGMATFEPGVETHGMGSCGGTLYHTVWYKFKLSEKAVVQFDATGDIYYSKLLDPMLVHRDIYVDLWKKDGAQRTFITCRESVAPQIRTTLSPGTYYVRLAAKKKSAKGLPSFYTLNAVAEPLGMPLIVDPPDNSRIGSGDSAVLSVVATGTMPMSYQWYTGQTGDTSNPIGGATASVYTTPGLAPDGYSYWVRVTNSVGSRDSETAWINVSDYGTVVYELLSNGGFEAGMTHWTIKNKTSDKVKCGTATLPPQGNGSSCAFVFKGGAGENSVLQQQGQSAITRDHAYARLRAYTRTTGAAGKLKAIIKIAYSDDPGITEKYKVVLAPTDDFTFWQSQEIRAHGLDDIAEDFSVTFKHTSAGGKMYLDDVSLTLTWSWFFRGAMPLPLPAAPDGFRGGN